MEIDENRRGFSQCVCKEEEEEGEVEKVSEEPSFST